MLSNFRAYLPLRPLENHRRGLGARRTNTDEPVPGVTPLQSDFIDYVCDQIGDECDVSYRHMFGGTTLYSKGKVVALICDNQLFVKPTDAGRGYIGDVTEAPAYEG